MDAEHKWSGKLVVSLVVVSVALPLLLLVLWSSYRGRRFLNPREPLPEHFKQVRFTAKKERSGSAPHPSNQNTRMGVRWLSG